MSKMRGVVLVLSLICVAGLSLPAVAQKAPTDVAVLDGVSVEPSMNIGSTFAIMVELPDTPAVLEWAKARGHGATPEQADGASRAQKARNQVAQQAVVDAMSRAVPGLRFLYRVQTAYNGIAVLGNANTMRTLARLPGVKGVHRIPNVERTNATSVPLIGSPVVWQNFRATGANVKVGVIDTGIDYTHTNFGGSGLAADFSAASSAAANPATNGTTFVPGFNVTSGGAIVYPTAKVAGGWDFAGDAYNAGNTPVPDPNPLDCGGHGSHVAGTIAGYGVNADGSTYLGPYNNTGVPFSTMTIGPGHAPQASLYALRVFGCSGSTNLVTQAIDWAIDPNGDGNLSDHLDVINMSLGANYGSIDSPDVVASDNAAAAGIIVVIAAGNNGDLFYTMSSPGAAARAITAASSFDDTDVVDGFRVETPGPATVYGATKSVNFNWASPPTALPSNANLYYPAINQYGCNAWTGANADPNVSGRILLVDWTKPGDATFPCGSTVRANNASNAGAIGIIMVDSQTFATTSISGNAIIPSMYTISTVGDALKANLTAGAISTENVTFDASLSGKFVTPGLTDTLSSFSSRGPRVGDSGLKPDVTAVGNGVFSTLSGSGNKGVLFSGTSMATPQTAGSMSLLKQLHPTWTVEELKALLMNSANHDLFTGLNGTGSQYGSGRVGAGRISTSDAVLNSVIAYNADGSGSVGISFGAVEVLGTAQVDRTVKVSNKGTAAATYTAGFTPVVSIPGVSFSFPDGTSVSVAGGASTTFRIRLSADASLMKNTREATVAATQGGNPRQWISEATGNLTLTPSSGPVLRLPVYAAARPASVMSTVESAISLPTDTSTATLTLTGTPVNTGPSLPNDYLSVVTPMELAAISPLATLPAGGTSVSRDADLKYVGVTSVRRSSGNSSRVNNSTILFGMVTQGNWGTASSENEFDVYLDTNNDGNFDYVLFNTRVTGTDVLVSSLFNLSTNTTVSGSSSFLNQVSSNTPTAPFNSNVIVMPLNASLLNMGANTRFRYEVVSFGELGLIDDSGLLTYDYAAPGLDFNAGGTGTVLYNDLPGGSIPITFNGPAYRQNQSKGALLLHHFNASGAREQVVPVACNTITVTNPANSTGTAASPFSEIFTSSGGLGTVTFSLGSGTLPAGLTLASNGTLSGTPTQVGSFPITVTATDGMGCPGTGPAYNLTITCQSISVTNPVVTTGKVGQVFNQTFTSAGGIGTVTFSTTSTLPTGLTLSTGGVLSGTPAQSGSFPIVVKATDQNGCFGNGATYNLFIQPLPAVASDFDGDRKSDIVLQRTNFDVAIWLMDGLMINAGRLQPTSLPPVRLTGDFDGDGKADLLWQLPISGTVQIAKMDGFTGVSITTVHPGTAFVPMFSGDFNGDGKADVVLQNPANGAIAVWIMNGATITSGFVVGTPGLTWQVVGVGDFNGDGRSDILLQNSATGDIAEWQMNGGTITGGAIVASLGTSWVVRAVGDINGDGRADIVLQNTTTGSVAAWEMNGFNVTNGAIVGDPGASFTVLGAGDFNGDGMADLILRSNAGDVVGWTLNGFTITGGRIISSPGTSWMPVIR
jgi:subtilisin family serine protease